MNQPNDESTSLQQRVAALEKAVGDLQGRLATRTPARVPRRRPTLTLASVDPGQWINRLGIALLLLGAAFGFKYSIDHGWIGPALRVWCGLALGAALQLASGRVRQSRPGLSRVLAGGGIACGYLSVFAAFQLYELISHGAAIAAMSAITLLAFAIAVRSEDAMVATIATIGGLATPFLLHSGSGSVAGLVGYTCAVAGGACAVFASRGWRVVLWTVVLGGWPVLLGATDQLGRGVTGDAVVVQFSILFLALATWWLSVMREIMSAEDPVRWKPTSPGLGSGLEPALFGSYGDWAAQSHQLTLATPVVVLFASTLAWRVGDQPSGWIALSLAVGWSLAAAHLRGFSLETAGRLAATHGMAAAVMVAFAMSLLLGDDAKRVGLGAEALAVLGMAWRSQERQPATLGHLLFAVVSALTFIGLVDAVHADRAGPTTAALADLAVVAMLAGAARVPIRGAWTPVYFLAAQSGLLLWFLRVLQPLSNGAAWVTAAWFTNAIVLVVAGLRLDSASLRTAGAALMALTMGKLFLVDMATVDALWRVVTFLGFGGALLGLGYAFPSLWKRDEAGPKDDA